MVREENMEGISGNILKKYDTFGVSQVVQCVQRVSCRRATERETGMDQITKSLDDMPYFKKYSYSFIKVILKYLCLGLDSVLNSGTYFQLLSKHFSCAYFKDNVFQLELILSLSLSLPIPDFSKPETIQHDCNGRF